MSTSLNPLAEYYTDDDLVRIFDRSKRTIARWRALRKLPYTLVGKTPRSSPKHVQEMLSANEVGLVRGRRRG
jgi:hypothetical protein